MTTRVEHQPGRFERRAAARGVALRAIALVALVSLCGCGLLEPAGPSLFDRPAAVTGHPNRASVAPWVEARLVMPHPKLGVHDVRLLNLELEGARNVRLLDARVEVQPPADGYGERSIGKDQGTYPPLGAVTAPVDGHQLTGDATRLILYLQADPGPGGFRELRIDYLLDGRPRTENVGDFDYEFCVGGTTGATGTGPTAAAGPSCG